MKTLEEVTYEVGRSALQDQENVVAGIRQRTGTLLAAHALVASFLGATTVRETGLAVWSWLALLALVAGLVAAATLLVPWRLKFAVAARELYRERPQGRSDVADLGSGGRADGRPDPAVADRSGGRVSGMAPQPKPPTEIKPPSTGIGIEEGRGGSSSPRPPRPSGS